MLFHLELTNELRITKRASVRIPIASCRVGDTTCYNVVGEHQVCSCESKPQRTEMHWLAAFHLVRVCEEANELLGKGTRDVLDCRFVTRLHVKTDWKKYFGMGLTWALKWSSLPSFNQIFCTKVPLIYLLSHFAQEHVSEVQDARIIYP